MKIHRRQFLRFSAGAAAVPVLPRIAWGQTYPTQPARIIVSGAAGSNSDILARVMGQWLSERFGQSFVVENRSGGGTNIATEAVLRAPADGHTLLLVAPSSTINATLYEKLNFNFIRDIAPVAGIVHVPGLMVVNPSVPAKTVPEFIAYAKANPGKINMASPGIGTGPHMAGELFKMMSGVHMVHVPYRGNVPALTDLIGGQVHVMFDGIPTSIEHVKSGKLRPLAVTTTTRSEALPDIPTVSDFVPGYEMSARFGLGAPRNTPSEVINKLNREMPTQRSKHDLPNGAARPLQARPQTLAHSLRRKPISGLG